MKQTYAITMALAACLTTTVAATTVSNVKHTFYGWPNNDPPSNAIAYDCGRGYAAGGDGSYDSPLTFASAVGEFDQCEIIYSPYLKKYLRYEDYCAQCTSDWSEGNWHIDIWDTAAYSGGENENNCDNALTGDVEVGKDVIRSPATNLEVESEWLD